MDIKPDSAAFESTDSHRVPPEKLADPGRHGSCRASAADVLLSVSLSAGFHAAGAAQGPDSGAELRLPGERDGVGHDAVP